MRKRRLLPALAGVLILGLSAITWAQDGRIAGTVTDSTGAVVPGAQVTARDQQTSVSRTTTTNAQGFYEFLAAKPSIYAVTIEAKGFEKAIQRDVTVIVGLESRVNIALVPGNLSETVEVKTEVPLIEPDKTNLSFSVEQQEIK
ncbi:MAG TPA: carboxypeptidase-like regulatory domain-containing protein, partial [Candidatus Angelobacter sp.]|nr:carboxypeptidase-like regulatory domain-containing protein [Candidatus Angelobacter sp.]